MLRTIRNLVLGLAALALLQVQNATAKDQVERPTKVWGNETTYIIYIDGTVECLGSAHETHLGKLSLWWDRGDALGTAEAANGDQIFWTVLVYPDLSGFEIAFIDGTGRFKNVKGGLVSAVTDAELEFPGGPVVMIMRFRYTGEGTIKY